MSPSQPVEGLAVEERLGLGGGYGRGGEKGDQQNIAHGILEIDYRRPTCDFRSSTLRNVSSGSFSAFSTQFLQQTKTG